MSGVISQTGYVERSGHCPACRSDRVTQSRYPLAHDHGFSFFSHCEECGSKWHEDMNIVGYSNLNASMLVFEHDMRGEVICADCGIVVSVPLDAHLVKPIWDSLEWDQRIPDNAAVEYAKRHLGWTFGAGRGYCSHCIAESG